MNTESTPALTARRIIYRRFLLRLLTGWFFISLTLGGGILWFEVTRVEKVVHELALQEAALLSEASVHSLEKINTQSVEHLAELAEQLIGQHFVMVDLYDQHKVRKVRRGHEIAMQHLDEYPRHFPGVNSFTNKFRFVDGQLWLVTLLPLKAGNQETPIGYFEGVYQVDEQTYTKIKLEIVRTLIFVSLGISFTTLLLYPIVLGLIKGVVKLSGEMLQGNIELLNVLGCTIAERDSDTNSHNYRVTYYAFRLGQALNLAEDNLRNLLSGAFLHDIGKIGIRDPILLKPGRLTPDEFEIMKTHVTLGVEILNKSSWLRGAREVVEFHHEKYDGSGYLQGLKAEQIPINARIFAIVDVFDSLTSTRPYKTPWTLARTLELLQTGSGSHFDPQLVKTFMGLAPELYLEMCGLDDNQLEALLNPIIGCYFYNTFNSGVTT